MTGNERRPRVASGAPNKVSVMTTTEPIVTRDHDDPREAMAHLLERVTAQTLAEHPSRDDPSAWFVACPRHRDVQVRVDQDVTGDVWVHSCSRGCLPYETIRQLSITDDRIRPHVHPSQRHKVREDARAAGERFREGWDPTVATGQERYDRLVSLLHQRTRKDRFDCPSCGAVGDGHGLKVDLDGERLLFHCFTCGGGDEILTALGLTWADIYGAEHPTKAEAHGSVQLWPPPEAPMAVARQYIRDDHTHASGVPVLRWWRGSFYAWSGTHWREVADKTITAAVYRVLEHAVFVVKKGVAPWDPTRHKVANVAEALAAIVHIPEYTEPPQWLGGQDGPENLVALANGLLDVRTYEVRPRSPLWFNLHSLPYEYQPDPPAPDLWLRFLDELFAEDADSIRLLQQWFGYVVSGDTNLHKILLLVGPPRSGKGTIARVLRAVLGAENVAGPTLASLGTNFGLSPLLGKALAVVSDARQGKDSFVVVERLLSISGEDAVTVDRKYREPWTGRLPTRFTVISNELPNLGDASGAVASRFVVLTLVRSWLGRENPRLTEQLLDELPGILGWALDGLEDLAKLGYFTEPDASRDAVTALADLTSPVGAFVRDRCERGPGHQVEVDVLYQQWRVWCEEQGRNPSNKAVLGRDLRAVVPGLKVTQPRAGGLQRRHYEGLALKPFGTDTR
jgi:putative DNA primase/helicase